MTMDHQFRMGVSGYTSRDFPGVGKPKAAPRYRRVLRARLGQIKDPMGRLRARAAQLGLKALDIGDAFGVAASFMREFAEAFKYKRLAWRVCEDGTVVWDNSAKKDRPPSPRPACMLSSIAGMMSIHAKAAGHETMSLHLRKDGVVVFTPDPHLLTGQNVWKERQKLRRYVLNDGEVTEKCPRMPERLHPGKSRIIAAAAEHGESKCSGLKADMMIVDDPLRRADAELARDHRREFFDWFSKQRLIGQKQ